MALKYESIISQMTLEEKASLMSGKTFWETKDIKRLNIPSIFLADGPHGIRKQAAASDHLGLNKSLKATCFPTASAIASSFNLDLAKRIGIALGEEARYQDVNVLLGPGINIKRNPLCGRNFEYFSEDPYLAGKMAANFIAGIQESGVSACVKHFCANSQELRRMNVDSVVDERALREIYLTNFEIAVKEGKPNCIMSSYNLLNGTYTNENQHLSNILRKEWGFDGVVVTDWGGNNDRVKGLLSGNQLEMPFNDGDTDKEIVKAVENGELKIEVLNEAVDKLLDLIFKTQKDSGKEYKIDLDKNNDLAQEAEEESIVLLKNDGVLPLGENEKIAVIGRFAKQTRYQGAGSSLVNDYKHDNFYDEIGIKSSERFSYADGFNFNGKINKKKIAESIKIAKAADKVILFIGLDELSEAEGIDRSSMKLPQNQLVLLEEICKVNSNVIVALTTGSAVEINFADRVKGIVHYHLGGQAVSKALANVLFGRVNPSGRLSESYPINLEDTPSYNYFHKKHNAADYKESIFVGYRYYTSSRKLVQYPYGYGLSYTKFDYSDLKIDDNGVTFKITNSGNVFGKEVAQLYIGLPESKIFRAKKELKGFKKVSLNPGESKEIRIEFDEYSFRFFNTKNNRFEIETGEYEITIGKSCLDESLKGNISITGNMEEIPYIKEEIPNYFDAKIDNISDEEFEKILGRKLFSGDMEIISEKPKRIYVNYLTTIQELKYAKGWTGRLFFHVINFAIKFLRFFGQGKNANTLIMGVYHQPLRGVSRFSGGAIHWVQLDGLILMFNGKFFKGLKMFFSEGRKIKKERKIIAQK